MTLFTITHPDGTQSTRESNKDLRWAVVVYTPKETRKKIREMQRLILDTELANIHRALADGTEQYRDDRLYIGGLRAASHDYLLKQWQRALDERSTMQMDLPDLYQATHWFDEWQAASDARSRLQQEYDATPWDRTVIVSNWVHPMIEEVPF